MCAVAFLLASCGASTRSGEPPKLAVIDQRLLTPCDGPVRLPDRDLGNEDVARHWGKDRHNLVACRERHRSLADVVTTERTALTTKD